MTRRSFVAVAISVCSYAAAASAAPMYQLTTLATFNGANGSRPGAGLIADDNGNLYGTTSGGGASNRGTVFKVAAGTHTLTTLATFNGTNGAKPDAGLIADANGNLCGTTSEGGANSLGTVFKLDAGTHALTTLATFDRANGAFPEAGLLADANGNLYGTTYNGGDLMINSGNGGGIVYQVTAGTHALTTLATFNGTNGRQPEAGLIADESGNLYGTTFYGGANDRGTVFKVANDANHTLTTLATFNGTNGRYPQSGLVADASGNLYGTTRQGGANDLGTVFQLAAGTYALTTLVSFDGTNGLQPYAGLIADASGNLFGTTAGGGANNGRGTVFQVAAETHALNTLATFYGTNVNGPHAVLIADASGNLFGTTWSGPNSDRGTVFQLSPVPEPSTIALAAAGVIGLVMSRCKRVRFAQQLSVVVVLALSATLLQSQNVAYAAAVRTVALSGQPGPGTPSGVNYSGFQPPVLNDAGQTAFIASITGSGLDPFSQGLWSEGSGSLALVARTGSQAPGTPSGVNFGGLSNYPWYPALNNAGQTAFTSSLTGSGVDSTNSHGLWSEGSGSLALVVRSGNPAPNTPDGVSYTNFDYPVLNDAGQTAFRGYLTGSGVVTNINNRGIWSEGSAGLALLARNGSQAAGVPSGVKYNDVRSQALNDAGQTAFYARLSDANNTHGIWVERSAGLALAVRGGDLAPGTPGGINFRDFFNFSLNNAGQTAFFGVLIGSGVDSTNSQGIWSEGSGSLALVARSGSQAPGTPSGVNYATRFGAPALNNAGQTAFYATLAGSGIDSTNNTGIWSEGSAGLALVARTGNQALGTPSGVNFSGFYIGSLSSSQFPALNDAGQTAFQAVVKGPGVDFSNDSGIWATDRNGALQLIVRDGDALEVAPGDFRTISELKLPAYFGEGDVVRREWFNNLGQLAFRAQFTDGSSGVFVSNLVAIPEPSSLLLATAGLLGLTFLRRARCIQSARRSQRLFYCTADARKKNTISLSSRALTSAGRFTLKSLLAPVVALSICAFPASAARGESIEWVRQLGTNAYDRSRGVSADGLGNVYISGDTTGSLGGPRAGDYDPFVSKYDAAGNLEWTRQFGTSLHENSYGVSADGLGNVYVSGSTPGSLGGPNAGGIDAFVRKYDAAGNFLWSRQLGTSSADASNGVSADGLGNIYISGSTAGSLGGPNAGSTDAFVAKYDAAGTLQWSQQLGTSASDISYGVSADGLGSVYISGSTFGNLGGPNAGTRDAFVSKYDTAGTLEWTRQLGTIAPDQSQGVSADGLGNVYISGYTRLSLGGPSAGDDDAFVSKYDAAGNFQWTRQLGSSQLDLSLCVSADGLGGVYISGYTGGSLGGPIVAAYDAFVSKYDAAGNFQWTRQIGSADGSDSSWGVSADGLGNVYISGDTRGSLGGPNAGDGDAFVAKITDANVPEPSSLLLVLAGAISLLGCGRRRRLQPFHSQSIHPIAISPLCKESSHES